MLCRLFGFHFQCAWKLATFLLHPALNFGWVWVKPQVPGVTVLYFFGNSSQQGNNDIKVKKEGNMTFFFD